MERCALFVVGRPKLVLSVVGLASVLLGFFAADIRIDGSVESLLSQDDADSRYYREARRVFGSDEVGVVGVLADDVYTPDVLRTVAKLTERLGAIDGVDEVLSLTNAVDPIADVIDPPRLIGRIPTEPADLDTLRATLADRPIYLKNLVAEDGTAAAINLFFADLDDNEASRVDAAVRAVLDAERRVGLERLYYTGLPRFKVYAAQALAGDLRLFLPLTLGAVVIVLFACFRSWRGVVVCGLTVGLSLVWTLGAMVLAGRNLSLGSIALPPLLLVLGTAYSLHLVAEYFDVAARGGTVHAVVLETLRRTGPPIVITAGTTVLGFLALAVSPLPSIRDMGVFSSLGILIALLLSLTFVPALLTRLRLPTRRGRAPRRDVAGVLHGAGRMAIRWRRSVIVVCAVLGVVAVWQLFSVRADSDFQDFFRPGDPVRVATDAINEHLVGSMAFYVVIDGAEKDVMKRWDTLRRVKDLQRYVDGQPGVEKTVSFVDYCELLDRGAQSGRGGSPVGPGDEPIAVAPAGPLTTFWEEPSQLRAVMQLVAGSPTSFRSVVSPDFSRMNVLVRTSLSGSGEISALADRIRAYADTHFPSDLRVRPTGTLILLTRTTDDIVTGQIRSLALAAGVIFVVMSAMFLSARVGLIAMLPNLFPVLVFFGLMGVSGAPLNLGTSIVAAVALGLAVDNTVHLMTRLSREIHAAPDQETALLRTLGSVGKHSLYASVVLFLGFVTLAGSTFVPIQQFGLLAAATLAVSFAADVLLLPALLATTRIITLWDVLYLKLGRDPQKTIPLFAGLRPIQARIVTLMGELRTFAKGEPLMRQGEPGREMFVLVNGSADAVLTAGGESRLLRTMHRGDVIGEMALIRSHPRTADVIAADDVEAIAVDERFLARMQRRYPRIGARIFLNLARMLSDRLEEISRRGVG